MQVMKELAVQLDPGEITHLQDGEPLAIQIDQDSRVVLYPPTPSGEPEP